MVAHLVKPVMDAYITKPQLLHWQMFLLSEQTTVLTPIIVILVTVNLREEWGDVYLSVPLVWQCGQGVGAFSEESAFLSVDAYSRNIFNSVRFLFMMGALGFSVLRFWLFFRSVFRFLCQKTSVSRFWCSLRFTDFPFFSIWFSVFAKNINGFSDFHIWPIWVPVPLRSERQLCASTDLE